MAVDDSHETRFQKTGKHIENVFLDLCLEKGHRDIAVSELVARAGIGRSTFYLHYDDVPALSAGIQERLLALADANMSRGMAAIAAHGEAALAYYFVPASQLIRANRKALLVYLGRNGSTQFIYRLKQVARANLRQLLAPGDDPRTAYLLEYMVSAGLGLIVFWLEDDMAMPPQEVVALLETVMFKGTLAARQRDEG